MNTIELSHIHMHHGQAEKAALNDVSFTLKKRDMMILLGRNGSGKSTLLKILTKQLSPTAGHIFLNNVPFHALPHTNFNRQIMMLNQQCDESLFPSLTVYENYLVINNAQFTSSSHKKRLTEQLEIVNPNLLHKLHLPVSRLSGGEKQALALALIFLNPPALLLLDEHTSALDPKTSQHLMALTNQFIEEYELTCLMTTHDLDIALSYGN